MTTLPWRGARGRCSGPRGEDERAKRATLALYRCAKDYLEIGLADGSVVLAAHGGDVVGDVDVPLETVAEAMEEVKMRARVRWFVMGHLHRAFVDEERGVASNGCWALSRPGSEKMTEKRDLGTAIVVHGNGRLELMRVG